MKRNYQLNKIKYIYDFIRRSRRRRSAVPKINEPSCGYSSMNSRFRQHNAATFALGLQHRSNRSLCARRSSLSESCITLGIFFTQTLIGTAADTTHLESPAITRGAGVISTISVSDADEMSTSDSVRARDKMRWVLSWIIYISKHFTSQHIAIRVI